MSLDGAMPCNGPLCKGTVVHHASCADEENRCPECVAAWETALANMGGDASEEEEEEDAKKDKDDEDYVDEEDAALSLSRRIRSTSHRATFQKRDTRGRKNNVITFISLLVFY